MQKARFAAHADRKDDYMFIVEHEGRKIGCVVLKGNAALNFYDRCGFWISGSAADHDVLTLNWPNHPGGRFRFLSS